AIRGWMKSSSTSLAAAGSSASNIERTQVFLQFARDALAVGDEVVLARLGAQIRVQVAERGLKVRYQLQEEVRQLRVEMLAPQRGDFAERVVYRLGVLVAAAMRQRVEHMGQRRVARRMRTNVDLAPVRRAVAVQAIVVVPHE